MPRRDIERALPNLKASDYSLESPETASYNCVAWAFSDTTSRWDPTPIFGYYWPRRINPSLAVDNFVAMFEQIGGFIKCTDGKLEKGFEKIAVYKDVDGDFSHVARQRQSGVWTSKIGILDDIDHVTPHVLEKDYGPIVQFLKRKTNAKAKRSS